MDVIDNYRSKAIIYKEIKTEQSLLANAAIADPDAAMQLLSNGGFTRRLCQVLLIPNVLQKGKVQSETSALPPKGEIHLILEVQDNGIPGLSSYRRIVVSVK